MAKKMTRNVRTTEEASTPAGIKPGLFAQNVAAAESIAIGINQELASSAVDMSRLNIRLSELHLIQRELIDQQARAGAAPGIDAEDVRKLQLLLAGSMSDIVTAAERHMAQAQAKMDVLECNEAVSSAPPVPPVDSLSPQGNDGQMEARMTKSEADITTIKIDVGVIKANGATKSDIADLKTTIEGVKTTVAEAKTAMIIWAVGASLVGQFLPALKEFLLPAQKVSSSVQAPVSPTTSSFFTAPVEP